MSTRNVTITARFWYTDHVYGDLFRVSVQPYNLFPNIPCISNASDIDRTVGNVLAQVDWLNQPGHVIDNSGTPVDATYLVSVEYC